MARRPIDPASIRAYAARDWSAAREAKRAYWRERLARGGLREAVRVTDELYRWSQLADPTWPTNEARDQDLATHQKVAAALARTATSRAGSARVRKGRVAASHALVPVRRTGR
jgi:hypothetical protein